MSVYAKSNTPVESEITSGDVDRESSALARIDERSDGAETLRVLDSNAAADFLCDDETGADYGEGGGLISVGNNIRSPINTRGDVNYNSTTIHRHDFKRFVDPSSPIYKEALKDIGEISFKQELEQWVRDFINGQILVIQRTSQNLVDVKQVIASILLDMVDEFDLRQCDLRHIEQDFLLRHFAVHKQSFKYDRPTVFVLYAEHSSRIAGELISASIHAVKQVLAEKHIKLIVVTQFDLDELSERDINAAGVLPYTIVRPKASTHAMVDAEKIEALLNRPLETLVIFVTTFFPGLPPERFEKLMGLLVLRFDCFSSTDADENQNHLALEWQREADVVLRRCGIVIDATGDANRGYIFCNVGDSGRWRETFLTKQAIFVGRLFEPVSDFYFEDEATESLAYSFAALVNDFLGFQIRQVDETWLLNSFERYRLSRTETYTGVNNIARLIEQLSSFKHTAVTVDAFFQAMTSICIADQRRWQRIATPELLRLVTPVARRRLTDISRLSGEHRELENYVLLCDRVHGCLYFIENSVGVGSAAAINSYFTLVGSADEAQVAVEGFAPAAAICKYRVIEHALDDGDEFRQLWARLLEAAGEENNNGTSIDEAHPCWALARSAYLAMFRVLHQVVKGNERNLAGLLNLLDPRTLEQSLALVIKVWSAPFVDSKMRSFVNSIDARQNAVVDGVVTCLHYLATVLLLTREESEATENLGMIVAALRRVFHSSLRANVTKVARQRVGHFRNVHSPLADGMRFFYRTWKHV